MKTDRLNIKSHNLVHRIFVGSGADSLGMTGSVLSLMRKLEEIELQ